MIKTNKIIEKNILRKAFLHEIELQIDSNYFIQEIENSLKETNLYYATNVKGKMTAWNAFNNNDNFLKVLSEGVKHISKHINFKGEQLESSWGLKLEKGDYTQKHNHATSILSGILYLNEVDQELVFPDIQINVQPKKGTFLLFSPWLDHYTDFNRSEESKYAIAFNFKEYKDKTWG
jgi:hypothetical protein